MLVRGYAYLALCKNAVHVLFLLLDRLNSRKEQPCRAKDGKEHHRKDDAIDKMTSAAGKSSGFSLKNRSDHSPEFNWKCDPRRCPTWKRSMSGCAS